MNNRGQNLSEYAIIIAVVAAALLAMQFYFKRGIQGIVKSTADEMGKLAEEDYLNATGRRADAQLLGVGETGMYSYEVDKPVTVVSTQIKSVLDNSGGRQTIMNDVTTTGGSWTSKYKLGSGKSFFSEQNKRPSDPGTLQKTNTNDK